MSRSKFFLCALILIPFLNLKGQNTFKIQGKVYDVKNQPISGVNILISKGQKILKYKFTDSTGNYSFAVSAADTSNLLITAKLLSYRPENAEVIFNQSQANIDFKLVEDLIELKEVSINNPKSAIIVKGDTTSYNLKAFRQGNEITVEDIIKKLPGMFVDDGGNISFKGTRIETVLLDNENFYKDKYQNLTQRFDQRNIDTIEAIENYVDEDILSNFMKSGKVALNLKLTKVKGIHISGSVAAAIGTGERFEVTTENVVWKDKFKLMSITSFDDISKSGINQLSSPNLLNPIIYTINPKNNQFDYFPITNVNANLRGKRLVINPNFIHKASASTSIKGSGQYYQQRNINDIDNETTYFGTNSFLNEQRFNHKNVKEQVVDYELETKVNHNSLARTKNTSSFTYDLNNINSQDSIAQLVLKSINYYLPNEKFIRFSNSLNFLKKQSDQTIINIISNLNISKLNSTNENELFRNGISASLANQLINNKNLLSDSYFKMLRKNKSSLSSYTVGASFNFEEFDSYLNFLNNLYQNKISNRLFDIYFKYAWYRTFNKYSLLVSSSVHAVHNKIDFSNDVEKKSNDLLPNISLKNEFKLSQTTNFSLSFNYETKANGIENRYQQLLLVDYQSFSKNNVDNLVYAKKVDLTVFFGYNDLFEKQLSINSFLIYGKRPISANLYEIDLNHTNALVFNNYSSPYTLANINASTLLPFISSTLKFEISHSKSSYLSIINANELKIFRNSNTTLTTKILSSFNGNFNGDVAFSASFSSLKDSVVNSPPIMYSSKLNLYYSFKNIELSMKNNFIFYSKQINSNFLFSNIKASYKLKDSRLSFGMEINNLFNYKDFVQQNRNNLFDHVITYGLNGRFLMTSARYNF